MTHRPIDISGLTAEQKTALLQQLQADRTRHEKTYPLSAVQNALWILYRLAPDDPAYNLKFAVWLQGPCDVRAVRQTIDELLQRHESLRTTFVAGEGGATQRVRDDLRPDFRTIDASAMSDAELERQLDVVADRPFDLENELPVRMVLYRQAEDRHVLLLAAHHVVIDYWSFRVLAVDIVSLYQAAVDRSPVNPSALESTYADFVRWQREMLAGPEGKRLKAYWEAKLAGELPTLELPYDRRPTPGRKASSRSHHFEIAPAVAKQLRQLAKSTGASMFTICTAVYQTLLHRYSGQEDIIIGTPMLGRTRSEFQDTVGFFVNMVPLRGDLRGNPTFREYLEKTQRTLTEALDHQEYPLPLMISGLIGRRDPIRSPLIQTIVVWDRAYHVDLMRRASDETDGDGGTATSGFRIERFHFEQRGSAFDLVFFVVRDTDATLRPRLMYNPDVFDEATIERMAGHYSTLLAAAAANPDRPIGDLEMLSPEEWERQAAGCDSNVSKAVPDVQVQQLFEAMTLRDPARLALETPSARLSYGELNDRADRLASYLAARGVGSETLVGLCLSRPEDMIAAMLAVQKSGAAYVPLDPDQGIERLRMILDDARCPVIVVDAVRRPLLPPTAAELIDYDVDRSAIESTSTLTAPRDISPDAPAYVIYTSGSTGRPNGVVVSRANLAHSTAARITCYPRAPERFLLLSPFTFDSSVGGIYGALCRGTTVIVPPEDWKQRIDALPALIAEHGVTDLLCTPWLWNAALQSAEAEQLRTLSNVIVAGAASHRDLLDRHRALAPQAEFCNEYGPTEATVWSTFYRANGELTGNSVPIGRSIPETRSYLLDRYGKPVPRGLVGELFIGGKGVARGYLNRPELTAVRFVPDPFSSDATARLYKTGDLVRQRPDGELEFVGRRDFQVKISGFRVELEEVEAALMRLPNVVQAAVVAQERDSGETRLLGYVVLRDAAIGLAEIRGRLGEHLPAYMIPAAFIPLPALPIDSHGKVDRRALPQPARTDRESERTYVAPRTPLEIELARIWADVLEVDKVSVDDNFFSLGGASNQVLQVAARAKNIGLQLRPEQVFQHPTIAELAAAYDEAPLAAGNTIIESLGVYLPPRAVPTAEVVGGCEAKLGIDLERLTGIRSRRMAGDDEFSFDLSVKAVEECLARSRFAASDVDLLICCNISRCDGPGFHFSYEPSTAVKLAARFGFDRALAFDVGNACAGMFTGIMLADRMLQLGTIDCAIVVSGEYITHLTQTAQREIQNDFDPRLPCLTLGDAGAAIALTRGGDRRSGFHAIDLYTLGRHAELCIAKLGENRRPIMLTDLLGMSAATTGEVMKHWPATAMRHGWGLHDVRHIIPHQVSDTMMNNGTFAVKDLSVLEEINVVSNIAERGNTATTTHSVAVWDQVKQGAIRAGENVLFGIMGSGMTIGAALYTFDDLPDRVRASAAKSAIPHRRSSAAARMRQVRRVPRMVIAGVGIAADAGDAGAAIDAGTRAAERCLSAAGYQPSDVGLLVYTGIYREEYLSEPAVAAIIAGRLKLDGAAAGEAKPSRAFDLLNGGVGTLQACYVAQQAMHDDPARAALIVAAEVENNAAFPEPRRYGLVEGGSALLLQRSPDGKTGFGGFVCRTFPEHLGKLETHTAVDERHGYLQIQRHPDLEAIYVAAAKAVVDQLLCDEGLNLADVRHIFSPQISSSFITRLAESLAVPRSVMVDVTRDGGDLFTSSLPHAWQHAHRSGRTVTGDLGILIALGSGVQAVAAVYHF